MDQATQSIVNSEYINSVAMDSTAGSGEATWTMIIVIVGVFIVFAAI